MGMVNIEQNNIIKIFSIAAVILLLPIVILLLPILTSIYGMNSHTRTLLAIRISIYDFAHVSNRLVTL
ncbi:hypothetical protein B1F79_02050 [Coxiella-like endosymbiont of Rhipicephalus sanguineus]|nr:hypothetical protein [Coxiella-like endosymbiont of Rhipicephalus sanguineus]